MTNGTKIATEIKIYLGCDVSVTEDKQQHTEEIQHIARLIEAYAEEKVKEATGPLVESMKRARLALLHVIPHVHTMKPVDDAVGNALQGLEEALAAFRKNRARQEPSADGDNKPNPSSDSGGVK